MQYSLTTCVECVYIVSNATSCVECVHIISNVIFISSLNKHEKGTLPHSLVLFSNLESGENFRERDPLLWSVVVTPPHQITDVIRTCIGPEGKHLSVMCLSCDSDTSVSCVCHVTQIPQFGWVYIAWHSVHLPMHDMSLYWLAITKWSSRYREPESHELGPWLPTSFKASLVSSYGQLYTCIVL